MTKRLKVPIAARLNQLSPEERSGLIETIAVFASDVKGASGFPLAAGVGIALSFDSGEAFHIHPGDHALSVHIASQVEAHPRVTAEKVIDAAMRSYIHTDGRHDSFAAHLRAERRAWQKEERMRQREFFPPLVKPSAERSRTR